MSVESSFVPTDLGRLHVQQSGDGPVAVLWHSLFVDSASWGGLVDRFAKHRRVVVIDGPAHGRSDHIDRDFTLDDCADAATRVLAGLDITDPVDWIGNAWGGHVGLLLAARPANPLRSLVTIGTPVAGLTRRERVTKVAPLVALYRALGPHRFLMKSLSDALLGADAVAAQPEQAARTMAAFHDAHRPSMLHAMTSVMLNRADLADRLPEIATPTLMLSVRDDAMGWRPDEARATAATMPNARVEEVVGGGHIAPLLLDADRVEQLVLDLWAARAV